MRTFSIYIKSLVFVFIKNLSLFKAELKKYFCPSFPESKIHLSMHHMHICFKF